MKQDEEPSADRDRRDEWFDDVENNDGVAGQRVEPPAARQPATR